MKTELESFEEGNKAAKELLTFLEEQRKKLGIKEPEGIVAGARINVSKINEILKRKI